MTANAILSTTAFAFAIAFALTPLFRHLSRRLDMLDVPSDRSMHAIPTPRSGGNAILAGIIVAALVSGAWKERALLDIVLGAAALGGLAIWDEIRALPVSLRFAAQLAIVTFVVTDAALSVKSIGLIPSWGTALPSVVGLVLAVLWLAWMVNAYNFMDGINGIGSVQAIVAGVVLGLILAAQGDVVPALLAFGIAAAAAGFLPWNLPSGSIFMGDVGSTALGFSLAALTLRAAGSRPLVLVIMPLFPFLFDATFTLIRRVIRRERFYAPHRTHVYQRLAQQGWSHARVTALYGALAGVCGTLAYHARSWTWPALLLPFTAALVVNSLIAGIVYAREGRYSR